MTDLNWTDKHAPDFAGCVMNDDFRQVFNLLARAALPFMAPDAYFSDLLWDAQRAAKLEVGKGFYLRVYPLGTNVFDDQGDAIRHCDPALNADGRAVIYVGRLKFRFEVSVVYRREGV